MRKKNIYIEITPFFPTEDSFRGAYIYDQVQALQRTGRFEEVYILRPASIFGRKLYYEYGGVRVFHFPCLESPSYLLNGIFDSINKWLFRRWWKRNGWKATEVTVAHAHVSTLAIYPLEIKKMNTLVTTVIQHHDLDPYTIRNGRWADKKWNLLFRTQRNIRVFNQIDHHICVSEKVKESLLAFPQPRTGECYDSYLQQLQRLQEQQVRKAVIKRVSVLYNGVDSNKFYPERKEKNGLFKIGCIANFVELKGHHTLLEACRLLIHDRGMTHIRLSLVGSGILLDSCKEYVRRNNLTPYISFEQEVQHSELCNYYNSLDLFVLPSFFEGFGCVFTEAAACGIPFITCANQGVEDYIFPGERDKWLCPVNDSLQLANLIGQYIEKPLAQKLVHSWDIDILITDYLNKLEV